MKAFLNSRGFIAAIAIFELLFLFPWAHALFMKGMWCASGIGCSSKEKVILLYLDLLYPVLLLICIPVSIYFRKQNSLISIITILVPILILLFNIRLIVLSLSILFARLFMF